MSFGCAGKSRVYYRRTHLQLDNLPPFSEFPPSARCGRKDRPKRKVAKIVFFSGGHEAIKLFRGMELYNKISLTLGSIGTALGLVNLIRAMRAEGVRLRVELTGRRLQDANGSGTVLRDSGSNLSAATTSSCKKSEYIFVITVSNLSNFSVVIKDLRVAVSDKHLSWKGRKQLRYCRFEPGWSSPVQYTKFDLAGC